MTTTNSKDFQKFDRDPRLFMAFLTLVVVIMYIISLRDNPDLHKPVSYSVFTLLIILHVILHWLLEITAKKSNFWIAGYIIFQGFLAFIICRMSGSIGMVFALFMGMIGESVGLLGINKLGLLALAYFLALSIISFSNYVEFKSLGWWALGTIPIVIFIVVYVRLYMRQIEARAQAQALLNELENANRQLSEYADRVEDLTITNERQRMARELHDTLSQGLAGLILQLEAVDAYLIQNNDEKAKMIIKQSLQHARTTLDSSRRAIDDLRLPKSEEMERILQNQVTQFSNLTGISCELDYEINGPIPEEISEAVTRSLAESLNNIAKHAKAGNVKIAVKMDGENLRVNVQDDGIGFVPEKIPTGHYGIIGMRERIHSVNGQLSIVSTSRYGTLVEMKIPFGGKGK